MVVSINKLKSSSFRFALAVSRSKNVSSGEKLSSSIERPGMFVEIVGEHEQAMLVELYLFNKLLQIRA